MSFTKEQREASQEAVAQTFAPKIYVEHRRLMMEVSGHDRFTKITVDVTPLYHHLKEMFTTDWQKQIKAEDKKAA